MDSEKAYLYDGFGANHMRSGTYADRATLLILHLLATLYQLAQIGESARSVRIGENNVCASGVPHTMCHSTAFPTILLQLNHADRTRGDVRRLGVVLPVPRSIGHRWGSVELVCLCKL